jgi:hypothetical protein
MQQRVALLFPPYCYQVIKQSLVHIICRQLGTASVQVQTDKSGLKSKIGLFRRHKGLKIPEFLNLKQKKPSRGWVPKLGAHQNRKVPRIPKTAPSSMKKV